MYRLCDRSVYSVSLYGLQLGLQIRSIVGSVLATFLLKGMTSLLQPQPVVEGNVGMWNY